ncbi:hypothetical protein [Roseibium suaedae]|uniref:Uncharacterized protein n=1 Tax=Roseibium suaedae TaxID=735517 RepID=A0A1M7AQL1_9HYPH|nr:hypothetical protein [Roseibium suaedae]SHL44896.1 hypothetical protein SAMN05444272_0612 [Roseibium suaedae]
MTNITDPHSTDDCPVPEALFSQMVSAPLETAMALAQALPETQRSRLAVYCYRRAHLRRLGLAIAAGCSKRSLVEESGYAGELIHFQALNMEATLSGDRYLSPRAGKRPISLHSC